MIEWYQSEVRLLTLSTVHVGSEALRKVVYFN